MFGRTALASWIALIAVALSYGSYCDGSPKHDVCPEDSTVRALSPRHVAKYIAVLGPLPMWALLAIQLVFVRVGRGRSAADTWRTLGQAVLPAVSAYLGLVTLFRYLHQFVSLDPSGHVFVIGLQLAPLCALADRVPTVLSPIASRSPPVAALPGAITAMILGIWGYFTFMTAAFYHTWVEVAISVLVSVWCYRDAANLLVSGQVDGLWRRMGTAVCMWALGVLVVCTVDTAGAPLAPPLITSTLYDALVFAFGAKLLLGSTPSVASPLA